MRGCGNEGEDTLIGIDLMKIGIPRAESISNSTSNFEEEASEKVHRPIQPSPSACAREWKHRIV